jgi:hypothetical protein
MPTTRSATRWSADVTEEIAISLEPHRPAAAVFGRM